MKGAIGIREIACLAIVIMFWSKGVSAQGFTTYADTANYIKYEIVAKKNVYVGNSFSLLLDSLQIKRVKLGVD